MQRRDIKPDQHCPAAALRRELGLAAVTIARRLDLPVKKVRQCLLQNAGFGKRGHVQIAIITENEVRQEAAAALAAGGDQQAVKLRLEQRLSQVGGCALACPGCDALGPVPFINVKQEVQIKRTEQRADQGMLTWAEDDMDEPVWTEVSVNDAQSAFDLAEEEGWRAFDGLVYCTACLGRIGEIMRERDKRARLERFLGEE